MRLVMSLVMAAASTTALASVPIADVYSLPAADRAQVNKIEQQFFDDYQKSGVAGAIIGQYRAIGKEDQIGPDLKAQLAKFDRCGALTTVQRVRTESSGNFVVRDHFTVLQGSCLLNWDLTFINASKGWEFNQFNVITYSSDTWKF